LRSSKMPKSFYQVVVQFVSRYSPYTVSVFRVSETAFDMEEVYRRESVYDLNEELIAIREEFPIRHIGISAPPVERIKIKATIQKTLEAIA